MWNKIKLINFFQKNLKKEVTIQKSNKHFFINGEINLVEELDLCGYKLFEVQLTQKNSKNVIYITLHQEFVGINMKLLNRKSKQKENKSLEEIPYKNILVTCRKFYG